MIYGKVNCRADLGTPYFQPCWAVHCTDLTQPENPVPPSLSLTLNHATKLEDGSLMRIEAKGKESLQALL